MKGKYRMLGGRLWGGYNLFIYELCFAFWGVRVRAEWSHSQLRDSWPGGLRQERMWPTGGRDRRPCGRGVRVGGFCQRQWEKQATWRACRAPWVWYLKIFVTNNRTHSPKKQKRSLLKNIKTLKIYRWVRESGLSVRKPNGAEQLMPWVESAEASLLLPPGLDSTAQLMPLLPVSAGHPPFTTFF